ncbi:hypothetical protein ILUMI_03944 [Ignelater luminosus]|uniref:Uncharacterized protein n=1 Tax=Ignelater luminosus TaxID=2038154 RepID=A0A8K0DFN0_IGNLU|nr:hypothetical protein ILUMI_03944 [Ignelater luminosus]
MLCYITITELEAIVEEIQNGDDMGAVYIPPDVDTLTDEKDLDDDVLLEKVPVTDVVGTFEVHVESSDDDEPIAEPSTSKMKKVVKQKLPLPSWRKENLQYSSSPTSSKFRKVEEIKQQVGGKTPLFYLVVSLIQSQTKDAFEFAVEEEESNTEQPRTTTSWGRLSRDS